MTQMDERLDVSEVDLYQTTWSRAQVVAAYEPGRGGWWSDPGEEVVFATVAPRVRGRAILDVGVGAGRTSGILRLLTDDYVGVDVTSEMVEACRRRYPTLDIRQADVRNLRAFPDARFDAVVFSYNGLDCVDHEGRRKALSELVRVLRPGGLLVFSTHNLDGPAYRPAPWRTAGSIGPVSPLYRAGRWAANLVLDPGRVPRRWRNWYHLRSVGVEGPGWATSVVEGEDFSHVDHFTTLAHQVDELTDHGLELEGAFDAERGALLDPAQRSTSPWFHVVAHKP